MDFVLLGKSALALGVMGGIAGLMLSVAAKRFHVDVDARVEAVFAALPGANCGACGQPSCFAVAEAMTEGTVEPSACTAGGQKTVDAVSAILGKESCAIASMVSLRHCGGGTQAARAYDYDGILTCGAAAKLAGSPLACPTGCIGFGDCVTACPFDAIAMDDRGLPVIDLALCTGCEACVRECPRSPGLLTLASDEAPVVVRCGSHDKAKEKRSYCPISCIACKKCEKECAYDAIHVVDFNAVVDYDKCTGCGVCVSVCPQECIDLHGRSAIASVQLTDGKAAQVAGFTPEHATPDASNPEAAPPAEHEGA